MFNEPFALPWIEALRLQREDLRHQRLWPDSPPRAGWLRQLASWLEADRPEPPPLVELRVPDGCAALLLLDGQPPVWLESGRHPADPQGGLMEVRLLVLDRVPAAARVQPALALDLPFERALLCADGEQLAILKEGRVHHSFPEAVPPHREVRPRPRVRAAEGDEDLAQGYSFV